MTKHCVQGHCAELRRFLRYRQVFAVLMACVLGMTTAGLAADGAVPTQGSLGLVERIDHRDTLAREPMLVIHPEGDLFVSGYPSQVTGRDWTAVPLLWRSGDGGSSWQRVVPGQPGTAAQGNSDVDLAVAPDGTLYFASMGFDRDAAEGTQIAIGVSADRGGHWEWQFASRRRQSDRPWVSVAPDGTAYAIWNDGDGVLLIRSDDSGRQWSDARRIAKRGGSSHLAVGPGGRLAVRVSPISAAANRFDADVDEILISSDGGERWTRVDPPAEITWPPRPDLPGGVPRWVEPLAWGADGALHAVWSDGPRMHHAVSRDLGQSWQRSVLSETDGTAFFPFLVASPAGDLAATWFVASGQGLRAHLALLRPRAGSGALTVAFSGGFEPQSWEERSDVRRPSAAGEYIPVAFLPGGDLGVITPILDVRNDRWGFSFWRFRPQP